MGRLFRLRAVESGMRIPFVMIPLAGFIVLIRLESNVTGILVELWLCRVVRRLSRKWPVMILLRFVGICSRFLVLIRRVLGIGFMIARCFYRVDNYLLLARRSSLLSNVRLLSVIMMSILMFRFLRVANYVMICLDTWWALN